MSFLDRLLGRAPSAGSGSAASADTETVRKIVGRLEAMPPDRARFVAAYAYVLSRVANADLEISKEETARMEDVVRRHGVPEDQAVLVVQIAKSQSRLFGHTEDFLVTREFAALATPEERRQLLDALLEVAAADGSISGPEEARVKQIASELNFSHRQYIEALRDWREHREVLRGLPGREG